MQKFDVLVVGGGPAGFFAAISAAEHNPKLKIGILEGSNKVLSKVLISGGGRCNVTHHCFDPAKLTNFYPRGKNFLRSPFNQFHCEHTVEWFQSKGVRLKTEDDGRMFPVTDSSKTIADCLEKEAKKNNIEVLLRQRVKGFEQSRIGWLVSTENNSFETKTLILASGSNSAIWKHLSSLGIEIVKPVPSLFTFRTSHPVIKDLQGVSVPSAIVQYKDIKTDGPLLVTHRGLSGPAILKLSAWGARIIADADYQFTFSINWLGMTKSQANELLINYSIKNPKAYIRSKPLFDLPKRLWQNILDYTEIPENRNWAEFGKKQRNRLLETLCELRVDVNGKDTFKEEFVTAGGIELEQVDNRTMDIKGYSGLKAVGEVLDIDAVTGGFNFQGSWTTGFVAGRNV